MCTSDNIIKSFSSEEKELFSLLDEKEKKAALEAVSPGQLTPYIFGKKYFFKNYFTINTSCLIPRPDTERVVEAVMSLLPRGGGNIADLCCGCGCIALSVLDEYKSCRALLVDISEGALDAARENTKRLLCADRAVVVKSDILKDDPLEESRFDIIVSNPPYLRSDEISLYPSLEKEPKIALDGGADGMTFYRRILNTFCKNLKNEGFFVFEIGYDQKEKIEAVAQSCGFFCKVTKDYGGNYRTAVLRRHNENKRNI